MINLIPSSTCRSDAIRDSNCNPYDSSVSEEKVSSLLNILGEGSGDSEAGLKVRGRERAVSRNSALLPSNRNSPGELRVRI